MQNYHRDYQKSKRLTARSTTLLRRMFFGVSLLLALFILAGCSTKKNTKGSRFYQAMTTRFNVYFNGDEAYKAGVLSMEKSTPLSASLWCNNQYLI